MKVLVFWVIFGFCWQAKALKYACPSKAWCVPSENCMKGTEAYVYNSTGENALVEFLCGVVSTEGYVCCEEKGLLKIPSSYTPTKKDWFYPKGNQTVIRGLVVSPWPGHEAPQVSVPVIRTPAICPSFSICVLPALCPSVAIRYSAFLDNSKRYQCGHTWDTASWTCCSIHLFVNSIYKALTFEAPVPRRVRKISSTHEIPKYSPKLNHYSKALNTLSKPRFDNEAPLRKRRDVTDLVAKGTDATNNIEVNDTIITIPAVETLQVALTNHTEFSGRSADSTTTSGASETSCGKPTGQASATPPATSYNANLTNAGLTREGQYPWHVAILSNSREYLCGGTIVSASHVITVAHCIDEYTAGTLKVRIGDYDLTSNSESFPSYDVELSSIVFHPNYTRATLKADLAVLVLKFQVLSLPNVARVCFPGERAVTGQEEECYVPGWASVTPARQGSARITNFHPTLKEAGLVIIGRERCQYQLRKVKSLGTFFKLLDGVTCVKGIHQKDSCHGDGGSGLVCRTSTGDFVLQGLISWSVGCDRGLPTALVDIGFYAEFILNVIRGFQFSSTSYNEAAGTASEGSASFSVDPLLSGIQGGSQSSSGNIYQSSTISSSGFGTSQQTTQSSGSQQSSYSRGQVNYGNAQSSYSGHVQGSSSSTNSQTSSYESSSTAYGSQNSQNVYNVGSQAGSYSTSHQNAQQVYNSGSQSGQGNQHSYNSAIHGTSSGSGTYAHGESDYQTSFGVHRPNVSQQQGVYEGSRREIFGSNRRGDYYGENQNYESQRYLEKLEDLEYYKDLKQDAYAKKEYYDGFAGGYDGYVGEDHDSGRYGEEYFDTFDEYLDKYDGYDNEFVNDPLYGSHQGGSENANYGTRGSIHNTKYSETSGGSHGDYTSGHHGEHNTAGSTHGEDYGSHASSSEYSSDRSHAYGTHDLETYDDYLGLREYDLDGSIYSHRNRFDTQGYGSSNHGDYSFGSTSEYSMDDHSYSNSHGGHDYDGSSGVRGHDYDGNSGVRGHKYDGSSGVRGHDYDSTSGIRGHYYDSSSGIRGHYYDSSSGIRGHDYDSSSGIRGHDYDGSSGIRGHDYDGSSGIRGHDYDSSSGIRGHDYDSSSGIRGHDYDSSSGVRGHDYDSSSGVRGHDYDRSSGVRGHDYDSSSGVRGHDYDSSSGVGGHDYDSSSGVRGHDYDSSSGVRGHDYDSSSGVRGHDYDSSSGVRGHDYDGSSSSGVRGHDYDGSSGIRGHDYDSSSGIRGHDYDSSSGIRGHDYDSSSGIRGHDYDSSSGIRGHDYDSSSGIRGYDYDSSSGIRGHDYDSIGIRGHDYDSSSGIRGHGYDRFSIHDYDGSTTGIRGHDYGSFNSHDYDSAGVIGSSTTANGRYEEYEYGQRQEYNNKHSYSKGFGHSEYGADFGSHAGYGNQFIGDHDYDSFGSSSNSKYDYDLGFNEHSGYDREFGHGQYMYEDNLEGNRRRKHQKELKGHLKHEYDDLSAYGSNTASSEYFGKNDRNRHGWQGDKQDSSSFNYEREHNSWHDRYGKGDGRKHETWHEGHKQSTSLNHEGVTSDQTINAELHARQAEEDNAEDIEQNPSDKTSDDFVPGQSIVGFLKKRYMGNE